jgi:dipeptidyl aminopeptidase/acylaminoacyl peptidase
VETRLTVKEQDGSPTWSPDGQRVAFNRRDPTGVAHVVAMPANGGPETLLFSQRAPLGINLDDWSPDGRFITYNQDPALWALPVGPDKTPFAFVRTAGASVDESHFAPNGRWIAYNSNESGTWQVYLAPWPTTGERWQVSNSGGADPRWRADGRELFYLALDGTLMSVEVASDLKPRLGQPRALFQTGIPVNPRTDHYAVTKDGQRFLIRRDLDTRTALTVVLNWSRLLANTPR